MAATLHEFKFQCPCEGSLLQRLRLNGLELFLLMGLRGLMKLYFLPLTMAS